MPVAPKVRLFVQDGLAAGAVLAAADRQAHYLRAVMRRRDGDEVALFNGRDGEWRAIIESAGRRQYALRVADRLRAQIDEPDLWLGFAPVKRPAIDLVVQKASELGAGRLIPVHTRFTAVERVNLRRLRAHAVESAEQCGRLTVPAVDPVVGFDEFLCAAGNRRPLIWADESSAGRRIDALTDLPSRPPALLVGPEGGFSEDERDRLRTRPATHAVSLGPRILRAETAAIALLVLWQARAGDWYAEGRPDRCD